MFPVLHHCSVEFCVCWCPWLIVSCAEFVLPVDGWRLGSSQERLPSTGDACWSAHRPSDPSHQQSCRGCHVGSMVLSLHIDNSIHFCSYSNLVAVWLSGNTLVSFNILALRQFWLVLGWVTVCGFTVLISNSATRPLHPSVGSHNEYQWWLWPLLG